MNSDGGALDGEAAPADAALDAPSSMADADPQSPADGAVDGGGGDGDAQPEAEGGSPSACPAGQSSGCPANHGCADPFPCVATRCGYTCLGQRADWPLPSRSNGQTPAMQRFVLTTATVLDEVTGLMWERYIPTSGGTFSDAFNHCQALARDGFDDFRLPSTIELTSLLPGSRIQGLDGAIFGPNPDGVPFTWAINPAGAGQHWMVHLGEGRQGILADTSPAAVRCVRRAAGRYEGTPQSRFSPVGSLASSSDRATGLTWEVAAPGSALQYDAARTRCEQLEQDGRSNWRLPLLNELLTTFDLSRTSPFLVEPLLAPAHECFWSATNNAVTAEDQLFVFFTEKGETNVRQRTSAQTCLSRCVSDT